MFGSVSTLYAQRALRFTLLFEHVKPTFHRVSMYDEEKKFVNITLCISIERPTPLHREGIFLELRHVRLSFISRAKFAKSVDQYLQHVMPFTADSFCSAKRGHLSLGA
jgi:hypothetical protein